MSDIFKQAEPPSSLFAVSVFNDYHIGAGKERSPMPLMHVCGGRLIKKATNVFIEICYYSVISNKGISTTYIACGLENSIYFVNVRILAGCVL
jgi:hypothetical protein